MKKIYLIAAVAAVISGLLLFFYLRGVEADANANAVQEATGQVVTPAADIPAYTPLTAEMLTTTDMPKDCIPANAVTSISDCLGLVSDSVLYPGEVLLTPMIGPIEEKAEELSYLVPEGKRAMAITVNAITGVGGYITAGDHVDLILYCSSTSEEGELTAYTQIVGDNIEVLAAGDIAYEAGSVYTTITLALTPEECREVYAAQALCSFDNVGCGLNVLLRSPGDEISLEHTMEDVVNVPGKVE